MSKSRLPTWDGQGLLSVWKVTESDDTRRFDQAWLRKTTDIGEGRRGNLG